MRLNLEDLPILSVGTVVHDRNFMFHDGEIKSKYFIILSNLIEDSYIYILTTSQLDTYKASIHDVCEITDPVFPKKILSKSIEPIFYQLKN